MPEPVSRGPGPGLRAVLVLPLVAAWVALLVVPGLQPEWLARSLLARFLPLGFLAVFVFPDRGLRTTRLLLVAIPAFLLGVAAVVAVLGWGAAGAGLPGPSDLARPAPAMALGIVIALAWRRGPLALLLLPFKLAFVALLLAAVGAGLLFLQSERVPAVGTATPVTPAEQRQLAALFLDTDPWTLSADEVRTVRLDQAQVDRLAAWLLPRVVSPARARVAFVLAGQETVESRASLALPLSRWLNLAASGRVRVEGGRLSMHGLRLRLGRVVMPQPLADLLAPLLAAGIGAERPLRPLLAAIRELHVEPGAVRMSYGRVAAPRGPLAELLWGGRR